MVGKLGGRNKKCAARRIFIGSLAETEGFEPSMRLYTPYSLSRGAPSATRSRFLAEEIIAQAWSKSNALCKARTANSMYFSSITTEVLISEVEII